MDLYALDHFQHIGHNTDKEVTRSMDVCSRIYKATKKLIRNSRLQKLDKFGKNLVSEELVDKVQNNTSQGRTVAEAATTVCTNLIYQHLLQLVKLHTMIQAFTTTLAKDMSTLENNVALNKRMLEHLT